MNKIKEEHLVKVRDHQAKISKSLLDIGFVESKKHSLLHDLAEFNKEVELFKQELEQEYGSVNINLEDGTFEEIKKDGE
ncbi:MAG: hypothetical protein N2B06_11565 [Clostridium sp.]|jgi:hypothetical protein|tara:strand:+ start:262 stop:498 length:237 start_codon:yes stop_codon:yes gene_type:complete